MTTPSERLQALSLELADNTLWTADQWVALITAAQQGQTPVPPEPQTLSTPIRPQDLRAGMAVGASREGQYPVSIVGKIYAIRNYKVLFDPEGRFSLYLGGWTFRRLDTH